MELPAEPMMEILVRSPVRSRLRFKSVFRSWRPLIEDPHFIAEHLKRSSSHGSSNRFLLATYCSGPESKCFTSLLSCETMEVLHRMDTPCRDLLGYVNIIISSNGIVCLSSGREIRLFNPATGEFRVLSNSLSSLPYSSLWNTRVYYGLGYNRGIVDYKLIKIIASCQDGNEPLYRALAMTLKFEGTVVDGVVHWMAQKRGSKSEVILYFDMGDDKFGHLSLPDSGNEDENDKRSYVFDELLGWMVYYDYKNVSRITLWLRNSEALSETWTRLVTIDPALGVCRPVGSGARGQILIEDNYGLVAYTATTTTGVARNIEVDAEKSPKSIPSAASEFPPDLTNEVLLRLPVKALVRFKAVCKPWLSLIQSPCFISRHLNRSASRRDGKDDNGGKSLLVRHRCRDTGKRLMSLLSSETLQLVTLVDVPPHIRSRDFSIIGSCDGIVCCASDFKSPIILWNPATRESFVLPKCIISQEIAGQAKTLCVVAHGFGYDHAVEDYKVVRIAFVYQLDARCFRAQVFAIGEGSWREVPALACRIYSSSCTAVNGILYWVAYNCGSDDRELILSFDLQDEVFSRVYLPDLGFPTNGNCTKLSVYEESLCLMVYNFRGRSKCLDLWIMCGEAGKESWTKRFSIGPVLGVLRPLCCGTNGKVFMEKNNGTLVIYDANNDNIQDLPIKGFPYSLDCHFYIESLVKMIK